jgi:hypothetical protein
MPNSEYKVPQGSNWCHDGKKSKVTKAMIDRVFSKFVPKDKKDKDV